MGALPPIVASVGTTARVRLGRDYYVRIEGNDYSVNPRAIGRFVNCIATPALVVVTCDEQIVATHERVWANGARSSIPSTRPPPAPCAPSSTQPAPGHRRVA